MQWFWLSNLSHKLLLVHRVIYSHHLLLLLSHSCVVSLEDLIGCSPKWHKFVSLKFCRLLLIIVDLICYVRCSSGGCNRSGSTSEQHLIEHVLVIAPRITWLVLGCCSSCIDQGIWVFGALKDWAGWLLSEEKVVKVKQWVVILFGRRFLLLNISFCLEDFTETIFNGFFVSLIFLR